MGLGLAALWPVGLRHVGELPLVTGHRTPHAGVADGPWSLLCTGVRRHGESFVCLGLMMTTPLGAIFFLGSVNRTALSPLRAVSSWVKTLTFWSGDAGAGGVAFLLGGVVSEACALSVYGGGQRRGENGGGLVEDSSLQCHDGGRWLGGGRWHDD